MLVGRLRICLIGLVAFLIGCSPDTEIPQATIAVTRISEAMVTNTAVSSPLPAATPTTLTSSTSEIAPTTTPTSIALTNTPKPTSTPHPTATPIFYDLPAWVVDPSMNILLVGSNQNDGIITLFNVDTGEQFEISVDVNDLSPTWLWQEGNYFLSPTTPRASQQVIDIETGELVELSHFDQDIVSPDGRYTAHIIKLENGSEVVILIEKETASEIELNNPFQDFTRDDYQTFVDVHWSSDGALLAVLYRKWYDDDNVDNDLAIYTASGELYRQYANTNTLWNNSWSSALPYRILYTDGQKYWPSMPCILDVISNEQTCLEIIARWAENQNVFLYNFTWSPDDTKISFLHVSQEERVNNNGVCYFDLITEEIICLIKPDDLQLERVVYPSIHFWSRDGHYLTLFFDNHGLSDVRGDLGVAIVKNDGQGFHILGREFSWPDNSPWRPPVSLKSEE